MNLGLESLNIYNYRVVSIDPVTAYTQSVIAYDELASSTHDMMRALYTLDALLSIQQAVRRYGCTESIHYLFSENSIEFSYEGLGDKLKAAIKAIVEFFKKVKDRLKTFFKNLFGIKDKTNEVAKAGEQVANNITAAAPPENAKPVSTCCESNSMAMTILSKLKIFVKDPTPRAEWDKDTINDLNDKWCHMSRHKMVINRVESEMTRALDEFGKSEPILGIIDAACNNMHAYLVHSVSDLEKDPRDYNGHKIDPYIGPAPFKPGMTLQELAKTQRRLQQLDLSQRAAAFDKTSDKIGDRLLELEDEINKKTDYDPEYIKEVLSHINALSPVPWRVASLYKEYEDERRWLVFRVGDSERECIVKAGGMVVPA